MSNQPKSSNVMNHNATRRQMMAAMGVLGAGGAGALWSPRNAWGRGSTPPPTGGPPTPGASSPTPNRVQTNSDVDSKIFTFALNLEYMEAEYYSRGASGKGLADQGVDVGGKPGTVKGGKKVTFSKQSFQDYADELAFNETAHVKFYRKTLGPKAVDQPAIDFETGFTAAAKAAGLIGEGEIFDPFANEINFFLGGMLFEDTGVTAYRGAAKLLQNKEFVSVAAGILAVEAYHMGMVRSLLYEAGSEAQRMANAVSDARDKLDGAKDIDQGIEINGKANIVPCDDNGVCFERTPRQVLNIVYLKENATQGGFYPNGMNGDFTGLV